MREDRERNMQELRRAVRSRRIRKARELAALCLEADRKPPELFKYIGLLALLEADFSRAADNLRRAHRLLPRDAEVLNGLGFLCLRQGHVQEALDFWLQTVALDPANPPAAYFLRKVRRTADLEHLSASCPPSALFKSPRLLPGIPPLPRLPQISLTPKTLLLIGGLILVLPLLFALFKSLPAGGRKTPLRPGINSLALPEGEALILMDAASARYTFQPEEIRKLLRISKRKLRERDHNEVLMTVNKILHSNATESVKARFRLLPDFLADPETAEEVKTRVNPAEYYNHPEIYRGTWLVADGRVSRIQTRDGITTFLLRTPDYARAADGPWTFQIRMAGTFDGLKEGGEIRLLGRFENVLPLRGHIITEGWKLWFQQTTFLEIPVGRK